MTTMRSRAEDNYINEPNNRNEPRDNQDLPAVNTKTASASSIARKKSSKSFFLAFIVGILSFVPFFLLMFFLGRNFERPDFLSNLLSNTDWFFWTSLLFGLFFSVLILLVANAVAENKETYAKGVPIVLLFILFFTIYGYYFVLRQDTIPRKEESQEGPTIMVYDNFSPRYHFRLNKGEKSDWIDFPANHTLNIDGNHHNYRVIYESGEVVSITNQEKVFLPAVDATRIMIESLSDGQIVYVYLRRR